MRRHTFLMIAAIVGVAAGVAYIATRSTRTTTPPMDNVFNGMDGRISPAEPVAGVLWPEPAAGPNPSEPATNTTMPEMAPPTNASITVETTTTLR